MNKQQLERDLEFAQQDHANTVYHFSQRTWLDMLKNLAQEIVRLRRENASLKQVDPTR